MVKRNLKQKTNVRQNSDSLKALSDGRAIAFGFFCKAGAVVFGVLTSWLGFKVIEAITADPEGAISLCGAFVFTYLALLGGLAYTFMMLSKKVDKAILDRP